MASEDSSSEEDTEKLKEATWSFVPAKTNGSRNGHTDDCDKKDTQSRRAVASVHDNDGNELQTTPEFRAHVAKKLGFVLDSCISEVSVPAVGSTCLLSIQEKEVEEDDEGFLLFSTSVPGECAPAPAPPKRRPVPSSSDSDSEFETRIREAAVTIADIVRPYYTEKTEENKDSSVALENRVDTCESLDAGEKIQRKKKKKKKKKILKLEEDDVDERKEPSDDGNAQSQEGTQEPSQPEEMKKKKKKKKKKKVEVAQWNGE